MKNSRTSLNKPFYDWVKEVREADKKIKELEDKLYYYNVKLIGYNSPNFEPRLSSTKQHYKDKKYMWVMKISAIENEILKNKTYINQFKRLYIKLNDIEREIFMENYLKKNEENYSKSYKYFILNKIARIYDKFL